MKKLTIFLTIVIVFALLTAVSLPAFAADDAVPEAQAETGESGGGLSAKAIAAAALIAIACATGAIPMNRYHFYPSLFHGYSHLQVNGQHGPPAGNGRKDKFRDDARSGLYRDCRDLRPHSCHTHNIRSLIHKT